MKIWLVFMMVLLTGCADANLPDYPVLGDLRILTVVANPPEASPGDTVTFTPVLSDLNGQGRTLNYTVQGCLDPGVGIGVTPSCAISDPGSVLTGTVTPTAGVSITFTGPVATFTLTMPGSPVIFNGRNNADQYNGVNYLVFYSVSVPNGGASVNSFLRVRLSTKTPKNQNPVITSVDLNGVATISPFSMPTAASNFRVSSSADSSETYGVMRNNGSTFVQTEQLIHTFFVSDGTFDFYRTLGSSENPWAPPASRPSGRGLVILTVTRDGRGGTAFQKIEMN